MDINTIQGCLWGAIVGFIVGCLGNLLANSFIGHYKPKEEEQIDKFYRDLFRITLICTIVIVGILFVLYTIFFFILI